MQGAPKGPNLKLLTTSKVFSPMGIQALVHTSGKCQLPTRTCLGPNVNLDSPLPESGRSGLEVNVCF